MKKVIRKNISVMSFISAVFITLFFSGCLNNHYNSQNAIETKYEIETETTNETKETETAQDVTTETETENNTEPTAETETESEPETESLTEAETENTDIPDENTGNGMVESILKNMTLEEKVCQMFVITPEDFNNQKKVISVNGNIKENLAKYPVGGMVFFASNLVEPVQTKNMLAQLQAESKANSGLALFTCIDEEGGRVARIGNNKAFNVEQIGAMANVKSEMEAFHAGDVIGEYLSYLGFNFDFAPDADVITNSENKVIGDRSFGTDAEIVSEYALAYAKGLGEHDVLATFKHFPGHGGTVGDTHEGYAFTDKNLDELMKNELVPFISAADNGVDAIMVAHISVPNILGDNTPCSLSHYMVTDVLRKKLGYNGLICTDALAMKAVANEYSSGEAAVAAILAGNDIILMPENFYEAYEGVLDALEKGVITEERINESIRRIIDAKLKIMK